MYKLKSFLIPLLLFFSIANLRAQHDKFEIYFSSGFCLPIGAFQDTEPTSIFTYQPDGSNPEFVGFSKEGHGYAETGFSINGGAAWHLNSWLSIDLGAGYSSNPVNSESVENHMTEIFSRFATLHDFPFFTIDQSPYETQYLKIGILYNKRWDRIKIHAGPSFGIASLKFPDYYIQTFAFQDNETAPNRNYIHTGSKPRLDAFLFGLKSRVNYSISTSLNIGLFAEYLNADFAYEIELDNIESPTDQSFGPFQDTVNYRVIQIGLEISLKI